MGRIETELQSSLPVSLLPCSSFFPPRSLSSRKIVKKNSLAIFKNSICFAAVAAKARRHARRTWQVKRKTMMPEGQKKKKKYVYIYIKTTFSAQWSVGYLLSQPSGFRVVVPLPARHPHKPGKLFTPAHRHHYTTTQCIFRSTGVSPPHYRMWVSFPFKKIK